MTSALSNIQMLPVKIRVHICIVSRHMAAMYNWTFVFEDTIDHLILCIVTHVLEELHTGEYVLSLDPLSIANHKSL